MSEMLLSEVLRRLVALWDHVGCAIVIPSRHAVVVHHDGHEHFQNTGISRLSYNIRVYQICIEHHSSRVSYTNVQR
jgi:hypothetical protein